MTELSDIDPDTLRRHAGMGGRAQAGLPADIQAAHGPTLNKVCRVPQFTETPPPANRPARPDWLCAVDAAMLANRPTQIGAEFPVSMTPPDSHRGEDFSCVCHLQFQGTRFNAARTVRPLTTLEV